MKEIMWHYHNHFFFIYVADSEHEKVFFAFFCFQSSDCVLVTDLRAPFDDTWQRPSPITSLCV